MGDGVMVLFGAPVATEDHAARACFAALAALDDVDRMGDLALPIRIGMSSGPVILRRTGRDDEDYDVAGITVHIAARLEQQAEPRTVLLAQQTADLVAGVANTEFDRPDHPEGDRRAAAGLPSLSVPPTARPGASARAQGRCRPSSAVTRK